MPDPAGRTGRPGNQTTYRGVNIRMPHQLKVGGSKPAPSAKVVIGSGLPPRAPDPAGRSHRPGNEGARRPINIRTAKPEKLRISSSKSAPILGGGVPGRQAGKFAMRPQNTGKKHR